MSNFLGQRLSFEGNLCTVRYIGNIVNTKDTWLGVEWDDPLRGKHSGTLDGRIYFKCNSEYSTAGSFIRPNRRADTPLSINEAIQQKYQYDAPAQDENEIRISGKQVEEVGFDKVRRQLADLASLRVVVLDGCCVATSANVGQLCPNVLELDMSRNLLEDLEIVLAIITQLAALRTLTLDGNRFGVSKLDGHGLNVPVFDTLVSLSLDNTLMEWDEIVTFASLFPSLLNLSASSNQFTKLSEGKLLNITELRLEMNNFTCFEDMKVVFQMPRLRSLSLKGNKINTVSAAAAIDSQTGAVHPIEVVDIAYNELSRWQDIDGLAAIFPQMTSLRVSYNSLYKGATSDEDFLQTVSRLPNLTVLNYSKITAKERHSAETFYLSKIARELASVPQHLEAHILTNHPRYSQLCNTYGEPVIRREEAKRARLTSIAAGLMQCTLILDEEVPLGPSANSRIVVRDIPASFTVYNILGLLRQFFGVTSPGLLQIRTADKILEQQTRPLSMLIDSPTADLYIQWDLDRVKRFRETKDLMNKLTIGSR